MMRRRIVYIPTYYYHSNPVYYSIAKHASEFEDIYFNTKEVLLTKDPNKSVDKNEVLNYFDEFFDVEDSFLTNILNAKSRFSQLIAYRTYASEITRVLSRLSPSCLVATHDVHGISVRICSQWARRNRIPFVVLQAVPLKFQSREGPSDRLRRRLINGIWGIPLHNLQGFWGQESKENYVFVWGQYFKEKYEALGKDVSRFHIVGNPLFDDYQYDLSHKKALRDNFFDSKKIRIAPASRVILYCTQPLTTAYERFGAQDRNHVYGMIREAIQSNKKDFFIIKVHPREEIQKYVALFTDLDQQNILITQRDNIKDLLILADVQISAYSSTSIQALIYGTPVILLRTENIDDYYSELELFDTDSMLKAKTIGELNEAINRISTSEFFKWFTERRLEFIRKTNYALDGKSAERFYAKIKDILSSLKEHRRVLD